MLRRLRTYLTNQSSTVVSSYLMFSVAIASSPCIGQTNNESCLADQTDTETSLTEDTFESRIAKCLEVEKCYFSGDVWATYQKFKQTRNIFGIERLISFLKLKVNEPATRHAYKFLLKLIIDDQFSSSDRVFEEAEYYFDINDYEKSLDKFLSLEEEVTLNPKLSLIPKLNIANVYFEMGRLKEARFYYSVSRYDPQLRVIASKEQQDFIRYIHQRILMIDEGLVWESTESSIE